MSSKTTISVEKSTVTKLNALRAHLKAENPSLSVRRDLNNSKLVENIVSKAYTEKQ